MRFPPDFFWKPTGETLGRGGQGDVHIVTGENSPDGPKYALKVLRNTASPQALKRFREEIKAVTNLSDPSIIQIIEYSQENAPFQYYVMEYFEGAKSLDKKLFSGQNPFHGDALASLDLFEKIIWAIKACSEHSPPIVHRDINPKNILVLTDGSIRLIDFGICLIEDGEMITLTDEDVGTRNYTSPECESGSESAISVRSDIYSASKVLWSTITSQRAFAREEPVFTRRSMARQFPRKSETWHLSHIFEKTIRANPEDRFLGPVDLLSQIDRLRSIIRSGFPPLETVWHRCPSCGWHGGNIERYDEGYRVFGNPNPKEVTSLKCNRCGFIFVRDVEILSDLEEERSKLR